MSVGGLSQSVASKGVEELMGIFDVPPAILIKEVAKDLKEKIQKPQWIDFVKTGTSRERAPQDKDFWFYRNASILYRVYKDGPVGTGSLRTYYGGRKNRGVKPEHHNKGSGKIVRTCLQELEKKGFIKKSKKGRIITGTGEKYLFEISKLAEKNIAAGAYAAKEKKVTQSDAKAREVEQALKRQEKGKEKTKEHEEKKKTEKK